MFLCIINQFLYKNCKIEIKTYQHKIKTITMESNKPTLEDLKLKYIESMSEKTKQAYLIAKNHLGTSFTLEKSNGYLIWTKEHESESNDK